MATIIDALALELDLDPAKFKKGVAEAVEDLKKLKGGLEEHGKDIDKRSKDTAEGFGLITKRIGEMAAAYLSFTAIKSFVNDLVQQNIALNNQAAALGISIEKLSAMNNMARLVGSSAQGMSSALGNVQQQLVQMNQFHQAPSQDFLVGLQMLQLPRGSYLGPNVTPESFIFAASEAARRQLRAGQSQAAVSQELQKLGIGDSGLIAAMTNPDTDMRKYFEEMKKLAPDPVDVQRIREFNTEMGRLEAMFAKASSALSPMLSEFGPVIRLLEDVAQLVTILSKLDIPDWLKSAIRMSIPGIGVPLEAIHRADKYRPAGTWGGSGQPSSTQGSIGGPPLGSGSGANYMRGQPLPGSGDLVRVETKAGTITVNRAAAADIQGAINDMIDAGAPREAVGAYVNKMIAGTNQPSMHAYGIAFDYGQYSRNNVDPRFRQWAMQNPDVLRSILNKRHLVSGGDWSNPDFGHFEWNPNVGSGTRTVKGSTFDDALTALGPKTGEPGIALPNRGTLGQMFQVTTPDGRTFIAKQTDLGPAAWTGRGVDINAELRRKMGYGVGNFPTDQNFKITPYHPGSSSSAPGDSGMPWYQQMWQGYKDMWHGILHGAPKLNYHPAMLHNQNVTHNNVSTAETHIGHMTVNTQATDARGLATEIAPLLRNRAVMVSANNISGGPV